MAPPLFIRDVFNFWKQLRNDCTIKKQEENIETFLKSYYSVPCLSNDTLNKVHFIVLKFNKEFKAVHRKSSAFETKHHDWLQSPLICSTDKFVDLFLYITYLNILFFF